jgi:hypothetical protein
MMAMTISVIDPTLTLLATVAVVGSGVVTLLSLSNTVSAIPDERLEKQVPAASLKQAA